MMKKIPQSVTAMLAKIVIKVELSTMTKAQYFTERDKYQAEIPLMDVSPIANCSVQQSYSWDLIKKIVD